MASRNGPCRWLGLALILAAAALPAAGVITPPERITGLSARWQWAMEHFHEEAAILVYATEIEEKGSPGRRASFAGEGLGARLGLAPEKEGHHRTFFLCHFPAKRSSGTPGFTKLEPASADSRVPPGNGSICFLGTFAPGESLSWLVRLFKNVADPERAQQVLLAVAIHPLHERVVSFLISAARTDPRQAVRRKAVFWLGLHPTEQAVRYLESLLRSDPEGNEILSAAAPAEASQ